MTPPVESLAAPVISDRPLHAGGQVVRRPGEWGFLWQTFRRHPFRVGARSAWLVGEFALAALDYGARIAACRSRSLRAARAHWLQRTCRRVLRVFNVELETTGAVPTQGLLVCNHLSYLDVLVLGAMAPAVFVAKREVRRWPALGSFARLAGTIFVARDTGAFGEQRGERAVIQRPP